MYGRHWHDMLKSFGAGQRVAWSLWTPWREQVHFLAIMYIYLIVYAKHERIPSLKAWSIFHPLQAIFQLLRLCRRILAACPFVSQREYRSGCVLCRWREACCGIDL